MEMGGNHTGDMNGTAPMEPPMTAEDVPSCEEIEEEFCTAFAGEDVTDCCLLDCAEQLQGILVCLVDKTTGADRSDCRIPECPEVTGDGEEAPAPAPTASAATGVFVKVAAVLSATFAFAML